MSSILRLRSDDDVRASDPPLTNGDDGEKEKKTTDFRRAAGGRFAQGNRGGPGNPYAGKVARLRSAMINALTEDDMLVIIRRVIQQARRGDVFAAQLVLQLAFGRKTPRGIFREVLRESLAKAEKVTCRREEPG